jgi:hypothetical protein
LVFKTYLRFVQVIRNASIGVGDGKNSVKERKQRKVKIRMKKENYPKNNFIIFLIMTVKIGYLSILLQSD